MKKEKGKRKRKGRESREGKNSNKSDLDGNNHIRLQHMIL